jgi:hypothetical protein
MVINPMRFPLTFIIFFMLAFIPENVFSQDNDIPYNDELGVGINLNTNGGILGGFMVKGSIYDKNKHYHYFSLELVNVKHPKEQRTASPITGNQYIYHKQNYLFVLRPLYGREYLLFGKEEDEGVRINGIIAGGLAIGLLKPYAIDYDYTNYSNGQTQPVDVRAEAYDPEIHTEEGRILGTGGLLTALSSSQVVPGLSLKTALNFEFGNTTTGVEMGGQIDIYPQKMIIIPKAQNTNVFTSIYINIYFSSRR